MEPTLWSDKSSLPDTIKQMDNQACKARTWVTMQGLLHGLDTQVLGHVHHPKHHSSPKYPFILHPPPPPFKDKVKVFVHIKHSVSWWTGIQLSWRQRAGLSPEYHRDCDIRGQQEEKKKNSLTWII